MYNNENKSIDTLKFYQKIGKDLAATQNALKNIELQKALLKYRVALGITLLATVAFSAWVITAIATAAIATPIIVYVCVNLTLILVRAGILVWSLSDNHEKIKNQIVTESDLTTGSKESLMAKKDILKGLVDDMKEQHPELLAQQQGTHRNNLYLFKPNASVDEQKSAQEFSVR